MLEAGEARRKSRRLAGYLYAGWAGLGVPGETDNVAWGQHYDGQGP